MGSWDQIQVLTLVWQASYQLSDLASPRVLASRYFTITCQRFALNIYKLQCLQGEGHSVELASAAGLVFSSGLPCVNLFHGQGMGLGGTGYLSKASQLRNKYMKLPHHLIPPLPQQEGSKTLYFTSEF